MRKIGSKFNSRATAQGPQKLGGFKSCICVLHRHGSENARTACFCWRRENMKKRDLGRGPLWRRGKCLLQVWFNQLDLCDSATSSGSHKKPVSAPDRNTRGESPRWTTWSWLTAAPIRAASLVPLRVLGRRGPWSRPWSTVASLLCLCYHPSPEQAGMYVSLAWRIPIVNVPTKRIDR